MITATFPILERPRRLSQQTNLDLPASGRDFISGTITRGAGVGSISAGRDEGNLQAPSVLTAVVDAGLVGDGDEINIGKVRTFAQRARSDLEIDGIAV